jgi:hypothetical protein
MTRTNNPRLLDGLLLLLAFIVPIDVEAQTVSNDEPALTFVDLRGRLQPGDGIYVVDTDGRRSRGFVEGLSDSSITLRVDGDRRMFGEAQVVSIRRVHDSLRNGAVIGALVGAGSLGLATASWGPEIAGPWALVGAGIGVGAGLAIDAALWRGPTVYRKVPGRVQFILEMGKERRGLNLSYRF